MYEKYVSNYYYYRRVESYNLGYNVLSNSILMNSNILTSSLSGQVICTNMPIRNRQNKKESIKINSYFSRDHWSDSIELECLWLLFQDFLSLTTNNMPENYNYPFLQINYQVFPPFKV